MLVRQLVGRRAGELVDMPYHVAQSCLAAGTAALPDATPKMRGLKIKDEAPEANDGSHASGRHDVFGYTIREVSRGWYNVFDADDNAVSEKNLRRDEAEALLERLGAE